MAGRLVCVVPGGGETRHEREESGPRAVRGYRRVGEGGSGVTQGVSEDCLFRSVVESQGSLDTVKTMVTSTREGK